MAQIPDFLIVGKCGNPDKWPFHARTLGCLWCYRAEREDGVMCDKTCHNPGYCGLTVDLGLLKVVPVQTAPNFAQSGDDELLLVVPSKRIGNIDVDKVRKQLAELVLDLGDRVFLFESLITLDGEIEWKRLPKIG